MTAPGATGEAGKLAGTLGSAPALVRNPRQLGAAWSNLLGPLLTGSQRSVRAAERYACVAERLDLYASATARMEFGRAAKRVEKELAGLSQAEADAIRADIRARRAVQDASVTRAAAPAVTPAPIGTLPAQIASKVETAKLQGPFRRDMDELGESVVRGTANDAERAAWAAFQKLGAVLGQGYSDGWEPAFAYVLSNLPNIRAADDAYLEALQRLAKAGATDQAAATALTRAKQARAGYTSKIKGLLGEGYVPRWEGWILQRDSLLEIAMRRAEELTEQSRRMGLGDEWVAVPVIGDLRIDGLESWDEAILLVQKPRTGAQRREARLFMAAQYKVEKRVSAVKQVQRDADREVGGELLGQAQSPLLTYVDPNGVKFTYDLAPGRLDQRPVRFFFAADGGRIPKRDVKELTAKGLEVYQDQMGLTIAEFDAVAERMMTAAAKAARESEAAAKKAAEAASK